MSEMQGDCSNYAWVLDHEMALADETSTKATAATESGQSGPLIAIDRWYGATLSPDADVHYVTEPEKGAHIPDSYAGLFVFEVPQDGVYRVSANQRVWITLASITGQRIDSIRFEMQAQCKSVFKSVAYPLKSNQKYWLQLTAAQNPEVKILITREPTKFSRRH